MQHDLAEQIAATLDELIGTQGFVLPIHAAALAVNGASLVITYEPAPDGLVPNVQHCTEDSGIFPFPINLMFVDQRGEAARVVISEADRQVVH